MRKARCVGWMAIMVLPLLAGQPALPQMAQGVQVQVLRYADLAELVNKHRGKVVVVDFWATFCPPCVKGLPHVVEMQKKYATQGLVTISVSLDQIKADSGKHQKVLQLLQQANAQFTNVILDEEFALAQEKLRFDGPPCVFVFNRQGKWVEFKEEQFQHELIEQSVIQFLKGP